MKNQQPPSYSDFTKGKDVQMLAMTSMILLQACQISSTFRELQVSK